MIIEIMLSGGLLLGVILLISVFAYAKEVEALNERLDRIIGEVKPTSNATVKRIGRIAEGKE